MLNEAAKNIVKRIEDSKRKFSTEEDVRVICEHIFQEEFERIGLRYEASYEVQISTGAVDALYNNMFIEYKKAGFLQKGFQRYVVEKAKYFEAIARQHHTDADRIYGVLLDGLQIGFFRKTASGGLVSDGPYDISEIAIRRLIQIADSTRKKALTSENLIKDLGAGSGLTGELVRAFWDALCHRKDVRTDMFYKEWSRLFGQVSAYEDGTGAFLKEAQRYGIELRAEQYGEFIFTLHTVYAVYIKHIALMILESRRKGEYLTAREWFRGCSLRSISEKIEDGDIFRNLGIVNFLEGDFFCWYVLEWTDQVESAVGRLITDVLEQYEPSTGELKPEILHDLLKELYAGLAGGVYHTGERISDRG